MGLRPQRNEQPSPHIFEGKGRVALLYVDIDVMAGARIRRSHTELKALSAKMVMRTNRHALCRFPIGVHSNEVVGTVAAQHKASKKAQGLPVAG